MKARGQNIANGSSYANGPQNPWRYNWEFILIKESQIDIWKFME